MEDCSVRDAAVRLNDWFGSGFTPACQQPTRAVVDRPSQIVKPNDRNPPLTFGLTGVDYCPRIWPRAGSCPEPPSTLALGSFPVRG
jgi:hypothetical protein